MLVLTLHSGESVQAQENFELVYEGQDEDQRPVVSVVSLYDIKYRIVHGKAFALCSLTAGEETRIDVNYGSELHLGETVIQFSARSRERLKVSISAPRSVTFTRPAQHGGSFLAG